MPIAFRSASSANTASAASISVTKPAGLVDGDGMLAFVRYNLSAGITVTPPTSGATWVLVGSKDSSNNIWRTSLYKKIASGEAASDSWGQSPQGQFGVIVMAASGTAGLSDLVNNWLASTTWPDNFTVDAPTLDTSVPGCLIVRYAFELSGNATDQTWASGATQRAEEPGASGFYRMSMATDDTILAAAGATGTRRCTWNAFAGETWAITVALAPDAPINVMRMVV